MISLVDAQPHDVLCPAFDADTEYYVTLMNLERFYWGRPPMSKAVAEDFVARLKGAVLHVEWRCSEIAKLPSLVILHAR